MIDVFERMFSNAVIACDAMPHAMILYAAAMPIARLAVTSAVRLLRWPSLGVSLHLYKKSSQETKTLLAQKLYCQSGNMDVLRPDFSSIDQDVQPVAQTRPFALRCTWSISLFSASTPTSTVSARA